MVVGWGRVEVRSLRCAGGFITWAGWRCGACSNLNFVASRRGRTNARLGATYALYILDDPLRHGAKAGSETLVPGVASRADMRSGHRGVSLRSARPEAKLYLSQVLCVLYICCCPWFNFMLLMCHYHRRYLLKLWRLPIRVSMAPLIMRTVSFFYQHPLLKFTSTDF